MSIPAPHHLALGFLYALVHACSASKLMFDWFAVALLYMFFVAFFLFKLATRLLFFFQQQHNPMLLLFLDTCCIRPACHSRQHVCKWRCTIVYGSWKKCTIYTTHFILFLSLASLLNSWILLFSSKRLVTILAFPLCQGACTDELERFTRWIRTMQPDGFGLSMTICFDLYN